MGNAIKHFITITKHRHAVIRHCKKAGIFWQGLLHDLSKYSPTEFFQGAKYYQGTRSPNDKAREELGYSKAWMHHMGRNRHHFEYWRDYSPIHKGYMMPVKMPLNYVVEMFCDRVAASKIYQGKNYTDSSAYDYFMAAKHRRVGMIDEESSDICEELLFMLKEQGEEKTFAHIRQMMKEYKYDKKRKSRR
ncbi:MAG: catalase [Ruminococcus sp.]|nr:catalase [Ruminococcus sp.]